MTQYSWTHNNHCNKGYTSDFNTLRTSPDEQWYNEIGVISRKPKSWKDECINSAILIRERTDQQLWVFLSGGIDSEIVLRSFYLAKIPVNIAIINFENDYNKHDVFSAIELCKELELECTLFNIDVADFWEKHFWDKYAKYQPRSPQASVIMNVIEQIDGIPILGMGDGYLRRKSCTNMFFNVQYEYESTFDKYFNLTERIGIPLFFEYTPEQILSYWQSHQIDQFLLLAKKIKLGNITPWKYKIYSEHFPEIKPRFKYHGYEILHGLDLCYRDEILKNMMDFSYELKIPYDEYLQKLIGNFDIT